MKKDNECVIKSSIPDYLVSNRKWCILTFLLIVEITIFTWQNSTINDSFLEFLNEQAGFEGSAFLYILFGNTCSAIYLVLLGIIPFWFGSLFGAFGALKNIILTIKYLLPIVGAKQLFLGTITHGIFEGTAFYLSLVLSVLLSKAATSSILSKVINKEKVPSFSEECRVILKGIIYILLPLLLIAAAFEVTVSWWIISSNLP